MRLNLALVLLPIFAVSFSPLGCSSSTTSDDSAANQDDGGDGTDDGGDTTGDGGTVKKDAAPPFSAGAYPSGYPQVPNNGGGIVSNLRLVAILPAGETTVQHFGEAFPVSATYTAVAAEYGLGTPATGVTITGGTIATGQLDDTTIKNYITSTVAAHPTIAADGHTVYLVFLPAASWLSYTVDVNGTPTVVSEQGCHQDGNVNANGIGGYHEKYGNVGDGWGVVQHCTGLQDQTDAQELEIAASHETVEAATDVDGFSGYVLPQVDPNNPSQSSIWDAVLLSEIGDLCVSTQISEGAYTYQRFWSNKAAKSSADPCIPAIPLFFNTGTVGADANGWFSMTGTTMTIPIEGFSTAATDPWVVASASGTTEPLLANADGFGITVVGSGTSQGQATIGNGQKGTVTVTATGGSGSWAEFELVSAAGVAGENVHFWPFGVYVP